MERITVDELLELADNAPHAIEGEGLQRAAYTIREMDKDIAVFEHVMEDMQGQFESALATHRKKCCTKSPYDCGPCTDRFCPIHGNGKRKL